MSQPKKREWWPIAIIASFVIFGIFIVVQVLIMANADEELVSPKYYDEEIRFQQQIDKHALTIKEGKTLRITLEGGNLLIAFPDTAVAEGKLKFIRNADASQDKEMKIATDANGRMTLPASQFSKGSWTLKAEWSSGGNAYYDEQKISIP